MTTNVRKAATAVVDLWNSGANMGAVKAAIEKLERELKKRRRPDAYLVNHCMNEPDLSFNKRDGFNCAPLYLDDQT